MTAVLLPMTAPEGGGPVPAAPPARWQDARVGEPTDAALLAVPGRGAESAFALVMRRHGAALYTVAYRRLGSAAEAEEAVQDAFLLLWRKRGGAVIAGDSALPWLLVTVQHVARNRIRSAVRRRRHEAEAAEDAELATPDGAESRAAHDLLERALATLAPLDARITRLCLAEDLTYAEAATRLGITEGAVRNRLSRARTRLRRTLAEDGTAPSGEEAPR